MLEYEEVTDVWDYNILDMLLLYFDIFEDYYVYFITVPILIEELSVIFISKFTTELFTGLLLLLMFAPVSP